MISFGVVAVAAFLTSGLTLYSGFGLGTLLLPVFSLFFPVEVAVVATALVHGANNVFKVSTVGKHADRSLVLGFGLPAMAAALAGAAALGWVSQTEAITAYQLGSRTATVTPVKLLIGALMFGFALFELLPSLRELRFNRKHLVAGGLLSGFFGGLSGHQGALRSAFLTKVGVSTEAFVGTNAMIGFLVDVTRLFTYAGLLVVAGAEGSLLADSWPLILTGTVSAFAGVLLGKKFLHGVTMEMVQSITGVLLIGIAVALGSGVL